MTYDAIVLGSGLGGLECAALLSRLGRRVLVLEQGAVAGGCMQSFRRRGLAYDTGLHYVGGLAEGQSLHAAFRALGLLALPWRRLDPAGFDRVWIAGREFVFAEGYDAFAARMAQDFPADRAALTRYTDLLRHSADTQLAALYGDADGAAFNAQLVGTNAWQWLCDHFADPLLPHVLAATSIKMELRQDTLPLFTFAHAGSGFIESSWRLQGDGDLLVQALAQTIQQAGGSIRCGSRAVELVEREGRIVAVRCADGTDYEAPLVISSLHPAATVALVKESAHIKKVYRRRMAAMPNTFGMATVQLRFRPGTVPYRACNRYVYRRPDVWTFYEGDGPAGGVLVSERVPTDGSSVEQIDLLTPMPWRRVERWADTTVGRRGDDYLAFKRRIADECVALAATVAPEVADYAECYVSTPLTYRDYTLTPQGSAYGVRKDCNNPLTAMLSPRTPVPNLFLTGQSLMLHGLHGVTMTALMTVAEAVGREQVLELIKP